MDETIHIRIRCRRLELGLSMEAVAKAVGGGLTWQAVQKWENGETAPNRNRIGCVAAALKTTTEYLLLGTDNGRAADDALKTTVLKAPPPPHPNRHIATAIRLMEDAADDDLRACCVDAVTAVLRAAKALPP